MDGLISCHIVGCRKLPTNQTLSFFLSQASTNTHKFSVDFGSTNPVQPNTFLQFSRSNPIYTKRKLNTLFSANPKPLKAHLHMHSLLNYTWTFKFHWNYKNALTFTPELIHFHIITVGPTHFHITTLRPTQFHIITLGPTQHLLT